MFGSEVLWGEEVAQFCFPPFLEGFLQILPVKKTFPKI